MKRNAPSSQSHLWGRSTCFKPAPPRARDAAAARVGASGRAATMGMNRMKGGFVREFHRFCFSRTIEISCRLVILRRGMRRWQAWQ